VNKTTKSPGILIASLTLLALADRPVLADEQVEPPPLPEVLESVAGDIEAPFTLIEGAVHSTYFEVPVALNRGLKRFTKR